MYMHNLVRMAMTVHINFICESEVNYSSEFRMTSAYIYVYLRLFLHDELFLKCSIEYTNKK